MTTSDYKNLITRKHLSVLLDCSTQTIARWEKQGMPVTHIAIKSSTSTTGSKVPRYDFLDVMSWIHKMEGTSVPE